uniref:Uncharacterized protein n=1 Tax=Nelumbo nucifera TaxID=4432 RepID=A0A822YRV2_NELNU|nr:TPA_asm: hypothetical protein HUJ06_004759 [Nelumbo nucifera]
MVEGARRREVDGEAFNKVNENGTKNNGKYKRKLDLYLRWKKPQGTSLVSSPLEDAQAEDERLEEYWWSDSLDRFSHVTDIIFSSQRGLTILA